MIDVTRAPAENPFAQRERPTSTWLWQAATGVVLIVVLTVHMVAHHFVVEGGLRSYAEVVAYLRSPVIMATEHLFLAAVTLHAMLGVRAVLLDLGPAPAVERRITSAVTLIGVLTVVYGVWLLWTVAL